MQINTETFKQPKTIVAISVIALAGLLFLIFMPLIFALGFANSKVENPISGKSFMKSKNPIFPEAVVFTEEDDGDVTANFVRMRRNWILWWKVDSISTQEVNNQDKEKSTDEVIKDLTKDVNEGRLQSGDNADVDQISDYDKQVLDFNNREYGELGNYSDASGNNLLKLKPTNDGGSFLELNGEKLPINGFTSSPAISPTGDRVCYSKYSKGEEGAHSEYSGSIFCMKLSNKQEELIYDFGDDIFLSLGVNKTYVLYSLSTGEIGIINLNTKEKKTFKTLEMFPESDPGLVVYMDEDYGVVDPNDKEKLVNKNERLIKIDFNAQTASEEN